MDGRTMVVGARRMGALFGGGVGALDCPIANPRLGVGSVGGAWLPGLLLAAGAQDRDRARPLSPGGSAGRWVSRRLSRRASWLARLLARRSFPCPRGVTGRVALACGGGWLGLARWTVRRFGWEWYLGAGRPPMGVDDCAGLDRPWPASTQRWLVSPQAWHKWAWPGGGS